MAILAAISWTVPKRYWPSFAQALAHVLLRLKARRKTRLRRNWLMLDDRADPAVMERMPAANLAHRYMARMQGYREYRPGGARAKIQAVGTEHIEAALAQGHGVVLWIAGFAYSDLNTKKGLHQSGYRVSHLSRPSHNISTTRFGIRVLNPVWTRIENRYLAERVTIRDNDSRSALATLRTRLKENRIVSITVGRQARRAAVVDLLSTKLRVPTGPLHLARISNAPLLPVFTVMGETGTIVVHVESPLMASVDDREESFDAVAQRYARRLEHYLLKYPDQWNPLADKEVEGEPSPVGTGAEAVSRAPRY